MATIIIKPIIISQQEEEIINFKSAKTVLFFYDQHV